MDDNKPGDVDLVLLEHANRMRQGSSGVPVQSYDAERKVIVVGESAVAEHLRALIASLPEGHADRAHQVIVIPDVHIHARREPPPPINLDDFAKDFIIGGDFAEPYAKPRKIRSLRTPTGRNRDKRRRRKRR